MSDSVDMPGQVSGPRLAGVTSLEGRVPHAISHGCGLTARLCNMYRAAAADLAPAECADDDEPVHPGRPKGTGAAMEANVPGIKFMMRGRDLAQFVAHGMRKQYPAEKIAKATGYTVESCARLVARAGFAQLAEAFRVHDARVANLRLMAAPAVVAKVAGERMTGRCLADFVSVEMRRLRTGDAIAAEAGYGFDACVERLAADGFGRLALELEWHDYEMDNLRALGA